MPLHKIIVVLTRGGGGVFFTCLWAVDGKRKMPYHVHIRGPNARIYLQLISSVSPVNCNKSFVKLKTFSWPLTQFPSESVIWSGAWDCPCLILIPYINFIYCQFSVGVMIVVIREWLATQCILSLYSLSILDLFSFVISFKK